MLAACQHRQTLLNSERIEQRYGSYGVHVIASDSELRISELFSGDGTQRVMRTLAIVRFIDGQAPAIASLHADIVNGGSIGQVFKSAGWTIRKRSLAICERNLGSADFPELVRMKISLPANLAIYQYLFQVERGSTLIDYAEITEIYHPDYLRFDDVRRIYASAANDAVGLSLNCD